MIVRLWHGWTKPADADTYEALLRDEVFPGIRGRSGGTLLGAELLRKDGDAEVEFVTRLRFVSLEAVKALSGEDYERAYVPETARALLSRFDARTVHYELKLDGDRRNTLSGN